MNIEKRNISRFIGGLNRYYRIYITTDENDHLLECIDDINDLTELDEQNTKIIKEAMKRYNDKTGKNYATEFINRFGMDDFSKLKYDEWYE